MVSHYSIPSCWFFVLLLQRYVSTVVSRAGEFERIMLSSIQLVKPAAWILLAFSCNSIVLVKSAADLI